MNKKIDIPFFKVTKDFIPDKTEYAYMKYARKNPKWFVYILLENGLPIYVGSSRQVVNRLVLHKRYVKFTDVILINYDEQCKFEDFDKMEQHYIDYLEPKLNRKLTWFERTYSTPKSPVGYKRIIELYNDRDIYAAR